MRQIVRKMYVYWARCVMRPVRWPGVMGTVRNHCCTKKSINYSLHIKDSSFAVSLGVKHDLGGSVPSCGHVLRQKASVVVIWVSNPSKTKVTNLQTYTHIHTE